MTNTNPLIVCAVCGETKPRAARGMCGSCYRRLWLAKELPAKVSTLVTRTCEQCGSAFTIKRSRSARGEGRYCSHDCAKASSTCIDKQCDQCGDTFKVKPSHLSRNQRYCSRACHSLAVKTAKPFPTPKPKRTAIRIKKQCEYCGHQFSATPDRVARFCSIPCRQKGFAHLRLQRLCTVCGEGYTVSPQRRNMEFCSLACYETTFIRVPDSEKRRHASRTWRSRVLRRDNHTCQHCGATDKPLHAHHLKEWSAYPELRTVLSNGLTLCEDCHLAVHHPHLAA